MPDDLTALNGIARAAHALGTQLSYEVMCDITAGIRQMDPGQWPYARARLLNGIANPGFRDAVAEFLAVWRTQAPAVPPEGVALALLAAAEGAEQQRRSQTVELVWTGPDSHIIPLRRTDRALLQVIDESHSQLTIVSFAVYKIEAIARAIVAAAQRGVKIGICLETPEASQGRVAFDTLRGLGEEVVQRAQIYIWPADQRPQSVQGRTGSLHAKVAVADSRLMLISSANLTEYAMTLNMELGVLVRGGLLPERVQAHFEHLISSGVLRLIGV